MRSKTLKVRVNEEEQERLSAKAKEAGLKLSCYLRSMGIQGEVIQPVPEIVTRTIGGFGRNLNQCAFHANSTGKVEVQTLEKLRSEVKQLVSLLQRRN